MQANTGSYFDQSAAGWDANPVRLALMKAVGQAILDEARPTPDVDVLDYGCGTGLVGLFLLPHVRSVTGADSSRGMLDVLRRKIGEGRLDAMRAVRLDLEQDPPPQDRYGLIVASMVLHHTANVAKVLAAFRQLLLPGGALCIADLDTEPGIFHDAQAAASVHHHGFDRGELRMQLAQAGFDAITDRSACVVRKPVEGAGERDFPVFLVTARQHGLQMAP